MHPRDVPRSGSPGSHGGSDAAYLSFPAREEEGQVVSTKPPSFQTSTTRDRYTPGMDTAEGSQWDTRPVASHQSSLTSLEECEPTERLPQKALSRAGGSHTEVSVPVAWAQKTPWWVSSVPGHCSPWPFSCVTLLVCHCSCTHKPAHQSAFRPSVTSSPVACAHVTVCQSWDLVHNCASCLTVARVTGHR